MKYDKYQIKEFINLLLNPRIKVAKEEIEELNNTHLTKQEMANARSKCFYLESLIEELEKDKISFHTLIDSLSLGTFGYLTMRLLRDYNLDEVLNKEKEKEDNAIKTSIAINEHIKRNMNNSFETDSGMIKIDDRRIKELLD